MLQQTATNLLDTFLCCTAMTTSTHWQVYDEDESDYNLPQQEYDTNHRLEKPQRQHKQHGRNVNSVLQSSPTFEQLGVVGSEELDETMTDHNYSRGGWDLYRRCAGEREPTSPPPPISGRRRRVRPTTTQQHKQQEHGPERHLPDSPTSSSYVSSSWDPASRHTSQPTQQQQHAGFLVLDGSSSPPSRGNGKSKQPLHLRTNSSQHHAKATYKPSSSTSSSSSPCSGFRDAATCTTASLSSTGITSVGTVTTMAASPNAPDLQTSQTFDEADNDDDDYQTVNLHDDDDNDQVESQPFVIPPTKPPRVASSVFLQPQPKQQQSRLSSSSSRPPLGHSLPSLSTLRAAKQRAKEGREMRHLELRKLQTEILSELDLLKRQTEGYRC